MRHVITALCLLTATSLASAQTPATTFEVATIRLVDNAGPNRRPPTGCERRPDCVDVTPTSLTIRNESMRAILRWAYDLPPVQVEAPDWLAQNSFDIVARAAAPTDEAHLRLMLQSLLAERFGVKVHTESRTVPGYAMTLAKSGPKFPEATTDGSFILEGVSPVVINAHHARMRDLALTIAGQIGRPVVDETGLTGRYEIHADLSAYLTRAGTADAQLDMMSILFGGLKELLGLTLESRKVTVDMLVVDHSEKLPTDN